MSLILLFLPHAGTPVNPQGAFTPGVIYTIEVSKPTISLIENNTPILYSSNLTNPTILSTPRVLGEFENSTVEYNSSTVAYSSSTETYGGMDRVQPVYNTTLSIDLETPTIYRIDKF